MKKLLLSIAIVLGGGGGLTCSSSLPATTQGYSTQLTKSFNINEVELSFIDLPGYQKADISGPVVPWNKLRTYDPSKIINIVYVSGSKYQHYTYTSLISILENSKPEERNEPIRFTIIYEEMGPKGELLFKGILDNDMTRLTNVLFLLFNRDIYKYDIEYIPIPDRERERISKFKSYKWPKSIFLKLFFSNFLSYDKCIYLDGDTACVNDIRRLWNINLGEYCFGGCIYQWFNKILAVNAGSLLYDLKKMRGVGFSDKIGEILRQKQKNSTNFVETLEEGALYAYSKKYGHCVIDQEFNTILNVTPRDIKTKHPTIIHYSGVSKPDANRVQQYEAAGCPSFEDTKNNFWETTWKHNPWSFWIWYEHYKKYREIENLANLD